MLNITRFCIAHGRSRQPALTLKSIFHTSCILDDNKVVKKPPELDYYPGKEFTNTWKSKHMGKIYDKKPFKFFCEKGVAYEWCSCGLSKTQPFCDRSHKGPLFKSILKPVQFIAPESKEYWFCNCKRTNHRPFCDGSHRHPDVIAAIKT